MKIGILADLTRTSGLGHFKRMLGLSEELERLKHKCFFIIDKSSLIFTKERFGKKVNFLTIKNNSIQNFLNIINKESIETVIFDIGSGSSANGGFGGYRIAPRSFLNL